MATLTPPSTTPRKPVTLSVRMRDSEQLAGTIRSTLRPAKLALPAVPWRHSELFTEPRYLDGQPYRDDTDLEDDGD